ncbi:MAG: TIGR03862 family flavoprotein [Limimaricola sp.]|uniref:TIGR03862 family flavoprotein n=1 Tax=Limimaricola sp. TaxID=2211665 RepID=UPI001D8358DF|nr:TIGR03862 family flavoprotein [Limimaricola sp.]MBI1417014.1 TIGR03862 family flavoprotein [Limimaricola sp.]
MPQALVIGAGPAGLMAADVLSAAGVSVRLADAMPTPGRKFLMAGKSGLNLTMDQPLEDFLTAFAPLPDVLRAALTEFGPPEVADWARGLGQEVFTGTSARVFPVAMKASPLLRAWLARLMAQGVRLTPRTRWAGWDGAAVLLDGPAGREVLTPDVTVLALGGASWSRLGSDGGWARHLAGHVAPFQPANMGLRVNWSAHMAPHFGSPVKGCALRAGHDTSRGEFVISARGLEGGGIYAVSRAVREGAPLFLDLLPHLGVSEVARRLATPRGKATLAAHLRRTLRIVGTRAALLNEFGRPLPADLAPLLKALPLRHAGPRPIDEAISTAGGLRFDALDEGLMLRDRPGTYAAGEMLDWEAPTGGYLITASLATGRRAGLAALRRLGLSPAT